MYRAETFWTLVVSILDLLLFILNYVHPIVPIKYYDVVLHLLPAARCMFHKHSEITDGTFDTGVLFKAWKLIKLLKLITQAEQSYTPDTAGGHLGHHNDMCITLTIPYSTGAKDDIFKRSYNIGNQFAVLEYVLNAKCLHWTYLLCMNVLLQH